MRQYLVVGYNGVTTTGIEFKGKQYVSRTFQSDTEIKERVITQLHNILKVDHDALIDELEITGMYEISEHEYNRKQQ